MSLMTSLISLLMAHLLISGAVSTTFTVINKCDYTVWPGILSNADSPPLSTTGFPLQKGESKSISAPTSWGGRMWARTHCSQDSTGKFSCLTADCGSGQLECAGAGATPPATLAEFKLDGYGGNDYFDVSLVDGYNLPVIVVPQGGSGQNCTSTGCVVDLNGACPSDLRVMSADGQGVACKSACEAFREPQYCCSGAFATPDTCKPSSYSLSFKNACPRAYSYAYDDHSSTFTCGSGPDYQITFCPAPNPSKKSSQGQQSTDTPTGSTNTNTNAQPDVDGTMVYEGASALDNNNSSSSYHVSASRALAVTATVAMMIITMLLF